MFDDLNIRVEKDVPLGRLTWYGVGGAAECIAHPSGVAQLAELIVRCNQNRIPMYVLGSGANLLVRECGVPGVVVRLDDPAFAQVKIEGSSVTAGAGYDLMKLVLLTAKEGLAGLEAVAGIPATVAAPSV